MLDHAGFPVSDYARSKAFYLQALAPLGYALVMEVQQHENDAPAAGFGANGKPDLWIGGEGGLQRPIHIAIAAQDRAAVDAFYIRRPQYRSRVSHGGVTHVYLVIAS
jgi:catechol 2,3-dioxygenase-like lactoylglutathione lyase family enzyme